MKCKMSANLGINNVLPLKQSPLTICHDSQQHFPTRYVRKRFELKSKAL